MSIEDTRRVITEYVESEHSDVSMMAEDVVFTIMATGAQHKGREGVMGMLNYFYHVAFDAWSETTNMVIGESGATLEARFIGKHIGEFAGIPPTGKEVNVPLCVVYDLKDDQITRGRVYMELPVMMAQLGIEG